MEPEDSNGGLDLNPPTPLPSPPQPVGIYGWRKRCIYAFVLVLMVVIIMNAALTIWILRVLNFSIDGMDTLKVTQKGVRIEGDAEFLKSLYTNQIQSKKDQSLYVMSNKNVQLLSTDEDKEVTSRLFVGKDSIEATCDSFKVQDAKGMVRMHLEGDKVYLGSKDASYPGTIQFEASVSTPTLRSPNGESLVVESTSSTVQVSGMAGVTVISDVGSVNVDAHDDIFMSSTEGAVHIQSPEVFIQNLPTTSKSSSSSSTLPSSSSSSSSDIFQLCACKNGKLYLAPARGDCRRKASDVCGN